MDVWVDARQPHVYASVQTYLERRHAFTHSGQSLIFCCEEIVVPLELFHFVQIPNIFLVATVGVRTHVRLRVCTPACLRACV